MLIDKQHITSILPHRTPMVMIDSLVEHSEEKTITLFTIEANNIFVRDGALQESGLIENIAQSAAASSGYYYHQNKLQQPLTYIASINKVRILKLPKVNESIQTEIKLTSNILNINVISGKCFLKDELIAECEMKVLIEPKSS